MRRWFTCILTLSCVAGLLSGCQFKDVDKRAFVLSVGFDPTKEEGEEEEYDKYELTLKIAIPEGDPLKGESKSLLITESGRDFPDIVRRMKSKIDKELDFSHCKVFLIGEKQAKKSLIAIIDWITRRRDLQQIGEIAVARPDARSVLETKPQSERLPGNALNLSLSKDGTQSPFITSIYTFDLFRRMTEHGLDPVLPIVEQIDPESMVINKVALLDKTKMITELSPNETRLYNLLTNPNLSSSFTVIVNGALTSYNMETSRAKYKIKMQDGTPVIEYKLTSKSTLEGYSINGRVSQPVLKEISKVASEQWEKDVKALLNKVKRTGLDPFGWGLRYYAMHWNNDTEKKEWEKLYPQLEFKVKANVQVKYSGLTK